MGYTSRANEEPRHWSNFIEEATGRAFDWRCPFCSADIKAVGYVHAHVSPVGTGIGFVPGNIVLACRDCNLSMGSTHAWSWCLKHGISRGWILTTLEILQKVFSVEMIQPVPLNGLVRLPRRNNTPRCVPSEKMELAVQWLKSNPEDTHLTGRELESNRMPMDVRISYVTWNKAKKEIANP